MNYNQSTVFQEEPAKRYGKWGIASVVYFLLIQAVLMVFCVAGIVEGINSLGHFNYSANHIASGWVGEVISMLIEGKFLMLFWGALTLMLSICIRQTAGWLLAAINYYSAMLFLPVFLFIMPVSADWLPVFFILLFLALQLLCLICFNRKAAKQFYKIESSKKLLLYNVIAIACAIAWIVFLFYNTGFSR